MSLFIVFPPYLIWEGGATGLTKRFLGSNPSFLLVQRESIAQGK
jgi:hypothetical protein